jgi:hypothetical protein
MTGGFCRGVYVVKPVLPVGVQKPQFAHNPINTLTNHKKPDKY